MSFLPSSDFRRKLRVFLPGRDSEHSSLDPAKSGPLGRSISLPAVLVIVATLLATSGCGGGSDSDPNTASTNGSSNSFSSSLSTSSASSSHSASSSGSSSITSSGATSQACPSTGTVTRANDSVYVISASASGGPGQVTPFTSALANSVGVLNQLTPLATGTRPTSVVAHPNGQLLYVVNSGDATVQTYAADDTGALSAIGGAAPFAAGAPTIDAASATLHPNGCFLYVTQAPTVGSTAAPTGQPLIAQLALASNGTASLLSATPTVTLTAPANGALAIDPTGQYAYVPVIDPKLGGEVCELLVGTNGVLTPAPNGCMPVADTPIEVTVSSDGTSLYVLTVCASSGNCSGHAEQYTIGTMGLLTTTGSTVSVANPVQLVLSPDGAFADIFTGTTQSAFTQSCTLCDACATVLSSCTKLVSGGDSPYELQASGAFGAQGGYTITPAQPPIGTALLVSLPAADYSVTRGAITENGIYAVLNAPQAGPYLTHLYGGADSFKCLVTPVSLPAPTVSGIVVLAGAASVAPATSGASCAPSVPGTLTGSSSALGQVTLVFGASTDSTGSPIEYKVYRNGTQIATTNATTFTDTGLPNGTSYNYTVAAYDQYGVTSAPSVVAPVKTAASDTLMLVAGPVVGPSVLNTSTTQAYLYGYGTAPSFGALTPSALSSGNTVQQFWDLCIEPVFTMGDGQGGGSETPPTPCQLIGSQLPTAEIAIGGFTANPGQAWLISASGPVSTLAGSSATYSYASGTATWTFAYPNAFGFGLNGNPIGNAEGVGAPTYTVHVAHR